MIDTAFLAKLLHDAYAGAPDHGGYAWHGAPLLTTLAGVTAAQAAAKPAGVTHSIWELVLHIANWDEITIRRLGGEPVEWEQDSPVDWPRVTSAAEAEWKLALDRLAKANRALCDAIRRTTPEQLQKIVPLRPYPNEVMLLGILQHDVYHAGQIAVVKKLVS